MEVIIVPAVVAAIVSYLLICWLFPRPASTVAEITLPW